VAVAAVLTPNGLQLEQVDLVVVELVDLLE
jgi:hypothetical protein